MYEIAKTFTFAASHTLDQLPEGHKCRRLHGHNYTVTVILRAPGLNALQMVRDYGDLDRIKTLIDATLDHQHLNAVVSFPPTAERLAQWLCERSRAFFPEVCAVRVAESDRTWAEYRID